MRAVTWHGTEDVRVDEVPDPIIEEPTDAIVELTSTAICGSDLHLYRPLTPFMEPGDILGHEPMGRVVAVGSEVRHVAVGDRVVVPFNISCGSCFMCERTLFAQCETTQVREHHKGAALFGYTKLYGHVPGAQAELLRVPQAHFGPIKVPEGPPDDRFLLLSDVLPTAWQAVAWADVAPGDSLAVIGLGPIGQMACRVARHKGIEQVFGVDLVPERLAMAERHGVETVDAREIDDVPEALRALTGGRGPDAVVDAVGMEAHGAPFAAAMQRAAGMLPRAVAEPLTKKAGMDRLSALRTSIDAVRRGGTLSLVGVYGGAVDPLPMLDMFDKGVQIRMGQAHVKRWVPEILPQLERDDDVFGLADFVTHRRPLGDAPAAYAMFQAKEDGAIKVVLEP
ncbi:MAG TPA: zinc-dependent alcohol dehydrogenase [Acidimicrobiales bacterium]|nr:zinc-dependent alcohol dehydrogenase [Acidimicrobiales bacterium]